MGKQPGRAMKARLKNKAAIVEAVRHNLEADALAEQKRQTAILAGPPRRLFEHLAEASRLLRLHLRQTNGALSLFVQETVEALEAERDRLVDNRPDRREEYLVEALRFIVTRTSSVFPEEEDDRNRIHQTAKHALIDSRFIGDRHEWGKRGDPQPNQGSKA